MRVSNPAASLTVTVTSTIDSTKSGTATVTVTVFHADNTTPGTGDGGNSGTGGSSGICNLGYQTHVQDIGWQDYVSNGDTSGTSGQFKRLEAIQIRLTGAAAENYDIYYCVHTQNMGWLDWAKNGSSAGTAGISYRLEAIKIVLVIKGGPAPGATDKAFVQG